jgi:histidine decarboxylase
VGSTFKGAIDDMDTLNAVLDRHTEIPAVYRHVDAALFGGYLPFTEHSQMVSSMSQYIENQLGFSKKEQQQLRDKYLTN